MTSRREQVLAALFAGIGTIGAIPGGGAVKVWRNRALPSSIPAGGLVILNDGEPGEPQHLLSPLRYLYDHEAEMIVAVCVLSDQDAAFDKLCGVLGAEIATDRTLGALCDWVEAGAPAPIDLPVENGASIKAARIPVLLIYATSDPLV